MSGKRGLRILGILYLILGIIILLNSFSGVTGFVVFEDADVSGSGFLGVVFVVIGILILMAAKDNYTLRREAHDQDRGGYHCTVYYRGRRTNLNTTMDGDGRIYIGKHGRGIDRGHHFIGRGNLRNIARTTRSLLKGRPTRPRGALRDRVDITDYL